MCVCVRACVHACVRVCVVEWIPFVRDRGRWIPFDHVSDLGSLNCDAATITFNMENGLSAIAIGGL